MCMSARGDWAERNASLPGQGQVLEADAKQVARLDAGRLDRGIGDHLAARMSVRDLRRGGFWEGSDGPRHAANLAWAKPTVLLGNGLIHQIESVSRAGIGRVSNFRRISSAVGGGWWLARLLSDVRRSTSAQVRRIS